MPPLKEVKTVVMDKNHFDIRDESFFSLNFRKLSTTNILMQGAISTIFPVEHSSTRIGLSIENLLEEFDSVVIAKYDIEYRQISEIKFSNFGNLRILMQKKQMTKF